jgi:signal peptidase I
MIDGAALVVRGFSIVLQDRLPRNPNAAPVLELVIGLAATWGVLRWILHASLGRAILAWLPTLLGSAIAWVLAFAVIRPLLFEAFVSPSNAMAPTILGQHVRSTCPSCAATSYVSASPLEFDSPSEELGICGRCFRSSMMPVSTRRAVMGDRFLVAKFLRPKRWDVVVFKYPEDPSIIYLMRLVGLPGEDVAIRSGDVWINGARAAKPQQMAKVNYAADVFSRRNATLGPVRLGSDEYFVLGDFSARAKDSRVWSTGAPGHPPYAVPKSHILGVVTHIYWPPSRWRVLR